LRAVDVYRHRAERENVELEVAIEPNLPIVSFDDRAIELLLMNLLDNALKYAKDGKVIRTEARARAGVVELLVIDRGPGIAENERRRIFERFVRGTVGVERQVRGSGIGLALVKHIAESHGGSAWVESELGRGSTFVVTVPAQPPAAGVATRSATGS
jgi:two-component system, OmpR family, phosphate regulon sensor histidine kinase PhoR